MAAALVAIVELANDAETAAVIQSNFPNPLNMFNVDTIPAKVSLATDAQNMRQHQRTCYDPASARITASQFSASSC